MSASGQSATSYFGVNVSDGDTNLGRRTPMHWARIGFSPRDGETYDTDFADHLVEALVDAWAPLEARFTTGEPFRIARRGGWKVAPAYRQWLHDVVGTVTRLPDGVTARRYGPGTLISMPDEWTLQQVVDASLQLYEWNGLDEFPKVAT